MTIRVVVVLALLLAACGGDDDQDSETATPRTLPTSSPCTGTIDASPRASDLEYEPGATEKTTLRGSGVDGAPVVVEGYVLFPDCRTVDDAILDVWQADADGSYDRALRGVFRSDEFGRYRIETVAPGDGVMHVKASETVGGRIVTTEIDVSDSAPEYTVRADIVIENG